MSSRFVGSTESATPWVNVRDFGATGNGVTDDTAAINAAVAALPSNSGAGGILYFPAGEYDITSGITIPSTKRTIILGDGMNQSMLQLASGGTGDMVTINALHSGVIGMKIDGGKRSGGGDGIVLNAGYGFVRDCFIFGAKGNGITVGKTARSILHHLAHLRIREVGGIGIEIVDETDSSDGQWDNIDIGHSGKNGVKIAALATQLSNVHVWASGVETTVDDDRAGYWLEAGLQNLTNCVAETNNGAGFLIYPLGSNANSIGLTGCHSWGNGLAGIHTKGTVESLTVTGGRLRNNGCRVGSANFQNDGGKEFAITGTQMLDNGSSHSATTVGTYPYPGRGAIKTVTRHYVETGAANYNALSGCVMRASRTAGGLANTYVGANNQLTGNVV